MIGSSVNRLSFIRGLPADVLAAPTLIRGGPVSGEQVDTRTVRELHIYLLYRASVTLTMKQAIGSFFREGDCTALAEERLVRANPPLSRTNATIPNDGP